MYCVELILLPLLVETWRRARKGIKMTIEMLLDEILQIIEDDGSFCDSELIEEFKKEGPSA